MKKSFTIIFMLVFVFGNQAVYSQFLKKLKERAEQKIEQVVIEKASEKAAQQVEKKLDKLFNIDFKNNSEADPKILPVSYDFDWKYILEMTSKQGSYNLIYYLKKGAKYFGSEPQLKNNTVTNGMFMVMDQGLNLMTIFMNSDEKKSGHIVSLPDDLVDDVKNDKNEYDNTSFKEIDSKEILGYQCQGFEMENKEMKMTMYVAFDSPVSFNQVFGANTKSVPKGFDSKWLKKGDNSIVMEMNFVNKKQKKYSAKMNCVEFEKLSKEIVVSDYEFIKLK